MVRQRRQSCVPGVTRALRLADWAKVLLRALPECLEAVSGHHLLLTAAASDVSATRRADGLTEQARLADSTGTHDDRLALHSSCWKRIASERVTCASMQARQVVVQSGSLNVASNCNKPFRNSKPFASNDINWLGGCDCSRENARTGSKSLVLVQT